MLEREREKRQERRDREGDRKFCTHRLLIKQDWQVIKVDKSKLASVFSYNYTHTNNSASLTHSQYTISFKESLEILINEPNTNNQHNGVGDIRNV